MTRHAARFAAVLTALATLGAPLAARAQADPMAQQPPPEVFLDRSGLFELVLNQAVLGQQVGGALTTAAFAGDPVRQMSGTILGLGAGIALPLVLTRGKPVPATQVVLLNNLERAGLLNGQLLSLAIQGWDAFAFDNRLNPALTGALGLAGLGGGLLLWDNPGMSAGQASLLGSGLLYGAATGAAMLFMFEVTDARAIALTEFVFANTGMAMAYLFRERLQGSRARVIWTDVGAYSGAILGAGLGFLFGGTSLDGKVFVATTLLGFWGGAILTYMWTSGIENWEQRYDAGSQSLLRLDERGLSMGQPVPQIFISQPDPGAPAELGAMINLLEVRL